MKKTFWAALVLPLLVAPVHAQSLLSRLGQAVGNAVTNQVSKSGATQGYVRPSTNDGLHNGNGIVANWDFPKYAPDTLDGYMHLRFGSAALDPFGNAVGGRNVCDREFVGYALLHRTALLPQDAQRCLSLEQVNDRGATLMTLQQRMATIAGTHKFYIRGTVKVDTRMDPAMQPLPPGKGMVIVSGGLPIISSPDDVDFRLGGPNWIHPGWRPGFVGNEFALLFNADPALATHWDQMTTNAYVFITISEPRHQRASTWQRGHTMYDVDVTVDKIVLTDNQQQIVLTPPNDPTHEGAAP